MSKSRIACWRAAWRRIADGSEATALVAVMTLFALLPVDWASALGGHAGRTIGPRLGASRRALRNLRRALPENGEPENRRIIRSMWDNQLALNLPEHDERSPGLREAIMNESIRGGLCGTALCRARHLRD